MTLDTVTHRMGRLLCLFVCMTWPAVVVAGPPNIVYILADDLGYGDLGCYGQQKIRTPALDQLAAEGLRFTQHYAGSAVCAPSRCVLLTGKHTGHAAIRGNYEWPEGDDVWKDRSIEGQRPLPAAETTVGELLQEAGYETACIGKWGLGTFDTEGNPNRQGFDHFFGYLCQRQAHTFYPTHLWRNGARVPLAGKTGQDFWSGSDYSHDRLTQEALSFLQQPHERPFFLYLPYTIPHVALQVPDDSLSEYRGKWDDPPYDGEKGYTPHRTPRAAYAAMITRMDRDIGRIVQTVDELGLADNTLIMFSSDNGPSYAGGADARFFNSAGGLRGLKGSLYEGGIRVPLVARWPGRIRAGSESDHVSAFCDMLPTFVELAGGSAPDTVDGISMVPTLTGGGVQSQHEAVYWELGRQQAVRRGPWKAIRRHDKQRGWTVQLFELDKDPGEQHDLATEQPEITRQLVALMQSMRTRSGVPRWERF